MKYGKGLGFVGYGEKLYQWSKDYPSVQGMEGHLKEGLLMFLWFLFMCFFMVFDTIVKYSKIL